MEQIRTSKGRISESESVIGNLLAAVDHIQDLPILTTVDQQIVKKLRVARNDILKTYTDESSINIHYHCIYKHLLLATTQLKELIQSYITVDQLQIADTLQSQLEGLNEALSYIRNQYLNYELDDDRDCIKCQEDYLLKKQNESTSKNN